MTARFIYNVKCNYTCDKFMIHRLKGEINDTHLPKNFIHDPWPIYVCRDPLPQSYLVSIPISLHVLLPMSLLISLPLPLSFAGPFSLSLFLSCSHIARTLNSKRNKVDLIEDMKILRPISTHTTIDYHSFPINLIWMIIIISKTKRS